MMDIHGLLKKTMFKTRCWTLVVSCMVVSFISDPVLTEGVAGSPEKSRPKIGVVLSGGGARGAAHIGVLKILEQMRIPIDYIVGTSMGSIVGGLYASGMTVAEIESVVTSLDWAEALQDNIPRENRSFRRKTDDRSYLIKNKPGLSDELKIKLPSGVKQGQNIDLVLKKLALPVSQVHDFDQFKILFRCVATDIVTGNPVILGSGDLATSMKASMAVPAIFSAIEINGKLLVDGGVSNNLPVDVVRGMGADIVIAIDISTPLLKREKLNSALTITQQLTGILTRRNTEEQIATLTDTDVFIVPDLGNITSASFERADEAIPIGLAAAEQKKQALARLTVPETIYSKYLAAQQVNLAKRQIKRPVIKFIRLDNQSRVSDQVIFARLEVQENVPLDVEKLDENISEIYGLELFKNISYEIVDENGQTGIVIHLKERPWGPNYLRAGLALSGDLDGDNFYNLGLSYTRTAINRLNGEWRSGIQTGHSPGFFTEIYQPLSYNSRYFFNPQFSINKKTVKFYSPGGDELANYRLKQYGVDLALGREFGTWGEFRIGVKRLTGDSKVQVGQPDLPDYDFDRGEVYVRLSADKLDNANFPREGYSGFIEALKSETSLGADDDFEQLRLEATTAMSWGRNTILAGIKAYTTFDDDAPIQNRFTLGGLFNLSGYNYNELSGQQLGLVRLAYMRRINDFNLLPTYIGLSLESGNVWEKTSDVDVDSLIFAGSVFLGVDTFLGPIYIGYGTAENNQSSAYFYLGRIF
jgi:NTE family protein